MSNLNEMSEEAKNEVMGSYNKLKDNTESLAHQFTEGAENLYEEGKRKINDLNDSVGEYAEQLTNKIKEKPLTSLLIAGGIGYLLSHLLRK